ncbi:hypothetical protein QAD02_017960 [Eretmocerus hayati]|uniref:Uncharacterized protein n=1 Tax=Eretmocerus hayati TaxID=131215 RepID=A0ACC2PGJ5_9HYME|nr:hypothetical protein QAD02_017960 [Eretmocerus hayati]
MRVYSQGRCPLLWTCIRRRRALNRPDESVHSHALNLEGAEALKDIRRVKRAATNHPEAPPAKIFRTQLRVVHPSVLAGIPGRLNLRKGMTRHRLRNMPANPRKNCGQLIAYSSAENLCHLFRCNIWFVNGTFSSAPPIFLQVSTMLRAKNRVGFGGMPQKKIELVSQVAEHSDTIRNTLPPALENVVGYFEASFDVEFR